jgi:3-phenylpropionate/trans-cinnamate dioxygenase ferredoxin subunit
VAQFDVAPADEFPPGSVKLVTVAPGTFVGVYNCAGQLYAIEDRCSHDDGPLCEGEWEEDRCMVVCPRHGSAFELATGRPISLPAYESVETYPVEVVDGMIRVSVD